MRIGTTVFCLFCSTFLVCAQDSLQSRQLDEVVVTATRNERTVGALPMPVSLIGKAQIKTMGSLRLNDVLTEQTGLVVVPQVNGQGNGIQLQGLNPDYTLILIDGEPLIGRYTGSLELSRIAVGNIKQIEIVKGPSSSLYGSDALAGVINIITERPDGVRANFGARYGANRTSDLQGDLTLGGKRLGVYLFANRYGTNGYDLSPQNFGKTVSPFHNYTFQNKISYRITPATDLTISFRGFRESQFFNFEVLNNGVVVRTAGDGITQDWNINPSLTHRFSDRVKTRVSYYHTQYRTETLLKKENDGLPYYQDDFSQTFSRPELQTEYYMNQQHVLTAGLGFIQEGVQTSRYGDETTRGQKTSYAFFQHEWQPIERVTVIAGGRYDHNSVFGGQFSPKLSSRFEVNKKVTLKLSSGIGFKAPDFRQLYFNFTNSAAGGYSVLGTEVAAQRLQELDRAGQIQAYLFDPAQLGNLKAEQSFSVNAGATVKPFGHLVFDANVFYNDINNLIETQAVAITNSAQSIYSYRNILRAYTKGVEVNGSYPVARNFNLSLGYQLLYAKDKDVAEAVRAGEVFYRDPNTLISKRLAGTEYFGLYNRSRHQGNIKIFYQNKEKGIEGSARVVYRGKFGLGDIRGNIQGEVIPPSDRNNNAILDRYDDFVKGYALVNLSFAKTFQKLRFQVGVDNVFNYREPILIPNLPGRLWYTSLNYSISKEKK